MKEIKKYETLVARIVASFLKKIPANVQRDDLMSVGMIAVWQSLAKGQTHENVEAYISIRVRGAILDELRAQDWLPRRVRESSEDVYHICDAKEVETLVSIDARPQEEALDLAREHQILLNVLERLPSRERRILEAHYLQGIKFEDIAKELGVSAPRVSQLHTKAMARLKELAA